MSRPAIGFKPVPHGEHSAPGTLYRWDGLPMRAPLAGEFYLSGAVPVAYRAKHNMSAEYFIAVPVDSGIALPVAAVEWSCHARTTIKDAAGKVLAEVSGHGRHSDEDEMIAAEITRRLNALDDLVKAAQRASALIRADGMHGCADELDAAIAKAK